MSVINSTIQEPGRYVSASRARLASFQPHLTFLILISTRRRAYRVSGSHTETGKVDGVGNAGRLQTRRWQKANSYDHQHSCIRAALFSAEYSVFFFYFPFPMMQYSTLSSFTKLRQLLNRYYLAFPSSLRFFRALAKVAATTSGNTTVASAYTFTLSPSVLIFPQLTASSGLAPASLPSNSCAVLM